MGQDAYHFVERGNFEVQNCAVSLQPVHNRSGGIEQLELNILFACPVLEKHEHPQAAAANRAHFGKIQHNDAGGCLRQHNIAKFENLIAAYDPAFALNDRQVT
jgi:hypothetical protein